MHATVHTMQPGYHIQPHCRGECTRVANSQQQLRCGAVWVLLSLGSPEPKLKYTLHDAEPPTLSKNMAFGLPTSWRRHRYGDRDYGRSCHALQRGCSCLSLASVAVTDVRHDARTLNAVQAVA